MFGFVCKEQKEEVGRKGAHMARGIPTLKEILSSSQPLKLSLSPRTTPFHSFIGTCKTRLDLGQAMLDTSKLHIKQIRAVLKCFQSIQRTDMRLKQLLH